MFPRSSSPSGAPVDLSPSPRAQAAESGKGGANALGICSPCIADRCYEGN